MYGELTPLKLNDGSNREVPGFPVHIKNPEKLAVLRLPTPDEILAFLKSQKDLYRNLGRQKGKWESVPSTDAVEKLFKAICIWKTEDFDEAEAEYAIGMITRNKVTDCQKDGSEYVVKLQTMFGETSHRVSIPFRKDQAAYQRAVSSTSIELPNGVTEHRSTAEAACRLYDAVFVSADGYLNDNSIPPHHKQSVVIRLLQSLEEEEPDLSPNS